MKNLICLKTSGEKAKGMQEKSKMNKAAKSFINDMVKSYNKISNYSLSVSENH